MTGESSNPPIAGKGDNAAAWSADSSDLVAARDSLQLAFREASVVPDPAGKGPGERRTGALS